MCVLNDPIDYNVNGNVNGIFTFQVLMLVALNVHSTPTVRAQN